MGKLSGIIIALIISVAALVVVFFAMPRLDRYLNIWAVKVCSDSANVTSKNGEITARYPIEDVFQKCLSNTK